MKVLIVEDDLNKLKQISSYLQGIIEGADISEMKSYQSGLRSAIEQNPDLIILDMSMPTFDLSPIEPGGKFRHYAGRDILKQLKRKCMKSKVIIVTMYESFGEGEDILTLDELKNQLENDFKENYLNTIFYQPATSEWKDNLSKIIESFHSLRKDSDDKNSTCR